MRNTLLFTSIIFVAISCNREDSSRDMNQPEGQIGGQPGTRPMTSDDDRVVAPGGGDTSAGGGVSGAGTGATTGEQPGATGSMAQPGQGQQPGAAGSMAQPGQGQQMGQQQAMNCDQIIPQRVREQYLQNTTVTPSGAAGAGMTSCRIEGGKLAQAGTIQAACNQQPTQTASQLQQRNPDGRMVQNVGKAAVIVEQGESQHLTAIDDDSNCQIDVTVPKNVDAVAIGRAMLDNLPGEG